MNIQRYFSPVRMGYLFLMDFVQKWRELLIHIGAACGVFLFIALVSSRAGGVDADVHHVFFGILLFLGLVVTGSAFKSAHRKLLNHEWLMLPASTLEKFLEKLILYSIVYAVAALILYFIFTLITTLIVGLVMGRPFPGFNPFEPAVWKMIVTYIRIQSVFLLGAAWFKSNNFIKTVLSLVLLSIILSILTSIFGWAFFRNYFWSMVRSDFSLNLNMDFYSNQAFVNLADHTVRFAKIFYCYIMPPICWFGAWLKLREVEVCDGI